MKLGKPIKFVALKPEEVIERDTERDFWMDSNAAVEYGLVDEVLEAQPKDEDEEEDKNKDKNKPKNKDKE